MQLKSKQRVADFGEVYTHEREVNAMLDLVQSQTERIDARFLEPACGTGNFLVEILRRKLAVTAKRYGKSQLEYERNAVIAVSSIYGIELLPDNVAACRERLLAIFQSRYQSLFPKTFKAECLRAAKYILAENILCGDALTLKQNNGAPIEFAHWSMVGSKIQRRDYVYRELIEHDTGTTDADLFSDGRRNAEDLILKPIKTHPSVHFLEVGHG